jgi:hypothetical protein
MGYVRPVLGVVLVVVGSVWTIQSYGTLKGSFMTGSQMWMWIGIACVVVGVLILIASRASIRK